LEYGGNLPKSHELRGIGLQPAPGETAVVGMYVPVLGAETAAPAAFSPITGFAAR
jgi:hypothetical protein